MILLQTRNILSNSVERVEPTAGLERTREMSAQIDSKSRSKTLVGLWERSSGLERSQNSGIGADFSTDLCTSKSKQKLSCISVKSGHHRIDDGTETEGIGVARPLLLVHPIMRMTNLWQTELSAGFTRPGLPTLLSRNKSVASAWKILSMAKC